MWIPHVQLTWRKQECLAPTESTGKQKECFQHGVRTRIWNWPVTSITRVSIMVRNGNGKIDELTFYLSMKLQLNEIFCNVRIAPVFRIEARRGVLWKLLLPTYVYSWKLRARTTMSKGSKNIRCCGKMCAIRWDCQSRLSKYKVSNRVLSTINILVEYVLIILFHFWRKWL